MELSRPFIPTRKEWEPGRSFGPAIIDSLLSFQPVNRCVFQSRFGVKKDDGNDGQCVGDEPEHCVLKGQIFNCCHWQSGVSLHGMLPELSDESRIADADKAIGEVEGQTFKAENCGTPT